VGFTAEKEVGVFLNRMVEEQVMENFE